MEVCKTPFPEVTNKSEVAAGELKKFPARLFAVPHRVAKGIIPGVTAESYQQDNKLWKKHVNAYKRINRLIGTARYRNLMDTNAGLGGFAAALESQKAWVMNVVPTIADNTLGVVYERGLVGIYHDCRFGEFMEIQFDQKGRISGATIRTYLLERLRVCQGGGRKPWNSINLVCAHDGFTLADLVTYNKKHNLPNAEDNNDGENHNNSWNCGEVNFICKWFFEWFPGRFQKEDDFYEF